MEQIIWLKKILREKLWWIEKSVYADGKYTPDEFLTLWVFWLWEHEFVKIFGRCEGYIILKPVPVAWVFDANIDYFDSIFKYDPKGDTVWIDSLWAPDRFAEVQEVLRATRRKFVAWEHGGKLRCLPISDLRGETLTPDQIRESLVRYCYG